MAHRVPNSHPAAQRVDLGGIIVFARDQERRDLEPDLRLMLEVNERFEHWREFPRAEMPVEMLGETLEIDVGSIHVAEKFAPRLRTYVAGAYRYCPDCARTTGFRYVHRIFQEDHRIVVGEGYRGAVAPHRG